MIGYWPGEDSVVIDVDVTDEGGDGFVTLERMELKHSKLPDTVCSQSPRGGRHYFYRLRSKANGSLTKTHIFGPNTCVDIRGSGGYVILPPSTRADGKQYEWLTAPAEGVLFTELLADLPEWVLDEIGRSSLARSSPTASSEEPALIYEGSRDSHLTSLAGSLRRAGLGQHEIEDILRTTNESHCIPPLPDSQVVKIARSVCR